MSQYDYSECLCKKCYIKLFKPSKRKIKGIVLSEYDDTCENCGRTGPTVEYVEDGDD